MTNQPYSKTETDLLLKNADLKLDGLADDLRQHRHELLNHMTSFEAETGATLMRIEKQTTDHNHRMTKIERYTLILGTAVLVVLALKFPEVAKIIHPL